MAAIDPGPPYASPSTVQKADAQYYKGGLPHVSTQVSGLVLSSVGFVGAIQRGPPTRAATSLLRPATFRL
jgi:hypothetical protein